jgi:hypothetical protein
LARFRSDVQLKIWRQRRAFLRKEIKEIEIKLQLLGK